MMAGRERWIMRRASSGVDGVSYTTGWEGFAYISGYISFNSRSLAEISREVGGKAGG
jgi:hypothetical protein